ncbi:MAG: DEAD/DEAH box helicase family protein [Candidatus Schekmanbacteria bacterium]|nr:DEAD/DEAH box helicase family protein [Candidatus Schekmanbacteria bacterium]
MEALYDRFLAKIPAGGLILDSGCGSGRDTKAFRDRGYRVVAIDDSPGVAELASEHTRSPVQAGRFQCVHERACYDGVWAWASLLHVPLREVPDAIGRLWCALKPGAVLFLSFHLSTGEHEGEGRRFTDANDAILQAWIASLPEVDQLESWHSDGLEPAGAAKKWINALVTRRPASPSKLVTGGENPFLPHLCSAISRATDVDVAVAFIKVTGLRLLLPELYGVLLPSTEAVRLPARVRVLTSDYLDVTDPEALRLLLLLQEQGAQVRVFETLRSSFHLKAYLCARLDEGGELRGIAFIGSSNISAEALQSGREWNYRVDYPGDSGFVEARNRFEELFGHPHAVPLTDAWIERYESRRTPPPRAIAPGSQEREPPPQPTAVQVAALAALAQARAQGYHSGLVVLATGLGKTWLAAFDAEQAGARRVLFVAHREEILNQAAETFLRVRPQVRTGFYRGRSRDADVDTLCASVQTIGRAPHLERFSRRHFDYIVVDEFHHAAAATYRRIINYFSPRFLLGLTATPDRTDQSDILVLCDEKLIFTYNLRDAISAGLLVPFHYFGILDETVDYKAIPWRNGRFDPAELSNRLATLARARHGLREWRKHAQKRTLAFCSSIRHAEFMAEQFSKAGVSAAAVYAGSELSRAEALERLRDGRLSAVFSVDLFNEGVDLPGIDTVMMLRPTQSKVLFLQQLGRGLRKAEDKDRLVVLDFVGNHRDFLHKPQALFDLAPGDRQLADFARKVEQWTLQLPRGCAVNYDLGIIQFLKSLEPNSPLPTRSRGRGSARCYERGSYEALRDTLGRRPTLSEAYRAGNIIACGAQKADGWFAFINSTGDLSQQESALTTRHGDFLAEVEFGQMTKSFKMVLLEALQELEGWTAPPTLRALAERSWWVLQRRRSLLADLPNDVSDLKDGADDRWLRYWRKNPVNAWIGGFRPGGGKAFFSAREGCLVPSFEVESQARELFAELVQELVDYRLASYEARQESSVEVTNVVPLLKPAEPHAELPYFPNLRIACGHFRTGSADVAEFRRVGVGYGKLDPAVHFIARASGNSMDGGKRPIRDGDYLLLELISPTRAGSITGKILAVERQDEAGDNQYLLRLVVKTAEGRYVLKANNPDYADLPATEGMRTLARLKAVLDSEELSSWQSSGRKDEGDVTTGSDS